jgi:hypothetical protein
VITLTKQLENLNDIWILMLQPIPITTTQMKDGHTEGSGLRFLRSSPVNYVIDSFNVLIPILFVKDMWCIFSPILQKSTFICSLSISSLHDKPSPFVFTSVILHLHLYVLYEQSPTILVTHPFFSLPLPQCNMNPGNTLKKNYN